MTHFEIDIVSDTVCPWCYVGLRNLKSAIAQRRSTNPDDTFSLKWHPFQLNPRSPKGQTIDKRDSYESKLGVEGARVVFDRIRSAGSSAGINFSFDGRIGSTLDSHRVIELAGRTQGTTPKASADQFGVQTLLVEELFADYFEREQDITSHDVLVNAAMRAGLRIEQQALGRFLSSDELAEEVRQTAAAQRNQGINGVPLFTLNDDYQIEGAQGPIAFLHLFNRLAKKGRAAL